jgi:hypothetical protein
MQDVQSHLTLDEPNYHLAAKLGADALPHLAVLSEGSDIKLASNAVILAGFINTEGSMEIIEKAAHSSNSILRVSAAVALRHLKEIPVQITVDLLSDDDVGVRKWALRAVEGRVTTGILRSKIEEIANKEPYVRLRERAQRTIQDLENRQ